MSPREESHLVLRATTSTIRQEEGDTTISHIRGTVAQAIATVGCHTHRGTTHYIDCQIVRRIDILTQGGHRDAARASTGGALQVALRVGEGHRRGVEMQGEGFGRSTSHLTADNGRFGLHVGISHLEGCHHGAASHRDTRALLHDLTVDGDDKVINASICADREQVESRLCGGE